MQSSTLEITSQAKQLKLSNSHGVRYVITLKNNLHHKASLHLERITIMVTLSSPCGSKKSHTKISDFLPLCGSYEDHAKSKVISKMLASNGEILYT